MSKHHLRPDTTCLNCGHAVPERFCTFCGQENVESRQSFAHLAGHFFEDLTHYEGRFWKTMLHLIGRPAYLTKAYLAGKRNSFVPPVRLYFFISFITFLLPHLLPDGQVAAEQQAQAADSAKPVVTMESRGLKIGIHSRSPDYHSLREMDSMEALRPPEERLEGFDRWLAKRRIEVRQADRHSEDFSEAADHNFPKALFIYLPLFAFMLWLFHGKKRWLYFDHAIFTIHYFCFIMLVWTIKNLLLVPFDLWATAVFDDRVDYVLTALMFGWFIYYFFRGHRKMYGESWNVSALKGTLVFTLNTIVFIVLLAGFIFYTLATLH